MVNRMKNRGDRDRGRSGFSYRPPDKRKLKERAKQQGGRFDSIFKPGVDVWKPKEGENVIRILPAQWEGAEYYGYDIFLHYNVGADGSAYLCPNKMKQKRCPICIAAKEAKDAGEEEEAKELNARQGTLVYMLDRDKDKSTPHIWQMSWTMDRDIAALCNNERTGEIIVIDDPKNGYDISFRRQGQGLKTRYNALQIDRDPRPIEDSPKAQRRVEDFIAENPIPSLLKFYPEDHLQRVIDGTNESKDPDMDDDDDDRKSRRRRDDDDGDDDRSSRRSRSARDEDDDDDRGSRRSRRDDDDDDDKPSSRRKGRDDDDDDDKPARRRGRDDDDDDDKPSGRRSRDADDDDDDDRPSRRRGRDDDDDDDDKPSRSRRGKDDDDDDKPSRSRRGRDDDDDDKSSDDDDDDTDTPRRSRGRVGKDDDDDDDDKGGRRRRR